MKDWLRRALREMLVCAGLLAIAIYFLDGRPSLGDIGTLFTLVLIGVIYCPIPWAIYRVGRFTLTRS